MARHSRPKTADGRPSGRAPRRRSDPTPSIEAAFQAGLYADILRRTVDGPSLEIPRDDVAYVVGALAFRGRVEEAVATIRAFVRKEDTPVWVAARFFVAVAHLRAGRYGDAERIFRENLARQGAQRDAMARFYVYQGLACFRYFTGRIDRAARHGVRALAAAFEARSQYARMLATDLRGHALVQLGEIHAGLALLEQARALAASLGLVGNEGAIACAAGVWAARFSREPIAASIEALERLDAETRAEDSYSRRAVQVELARSLAIAGRADAAWGIVGRLLEQPLPDGDLRARVRLQLCLASLARLRHGAASAAHYAAEARRWIAQIDDLGLEIDLLVTELTLAPLDAERRSRLEELARRSKIAAARAALEGGDGRSEAHRGLDRHGGPTTHDLWRECQSASPDDPRDDGAPQRAALDEVLRRGCFGLAPLALGLEPGRRLIVTRGVVLVEDHGNVRALGDVPSQVLTLLDVLGDGATHTKESLVRRVWGLPTYRPERHDAIVHTAMSRLRAALGTAAHWLEAHDGGYRFAAGVEVFGARRATERHAPGTLPPPAAPAQEATAAENEKLLATLRRGEPLSTAEVARALGVSEMTAFRRLRTLVDAGAVVRDGRGKTTRYSPAPSTPDKAPSRTP